MGEGTREGYSIGLVEHAMLCERDTSSKIMREARTKKAEATDEGGTVGAVEYA